MVEMHVFYTLHVRRASHVGKYMDIIQYLEDEKNYRYMPGVDIDIF